MQITPEYLDLGLSLTILNLKTLLLKAKSRRQRLSLILKYTDSIKSFNRLS